MNSIMERLCFAFEAAADGKGPKELYQSKGVGLSPWATWTLATLVRRVSRERWARRIAVEQLHVAMPVRDEAGLLTGWIEPTTGEVPTVAGWDFSLQGFIYTMTNRDSGERIKCHLGETYGRRIDVWLLSNYLNALKKPSFPESRLKVLHPHGDSLEPSLDELVDHELLVGEKGTYYLCADFERLADALQKMEAVWHDDAGRREAALTVGDFLYLTDLGDDEAADLHDAAAHVRSLRGRRLLDRFHSADDLQVPGLLLAMRQIDAPDLGESIRNIFDGHLRNPQEHRFGLECAIDVAAQLKKPDLLKDVHDVFVRLTHLEQTSSVAWYRAGRALGLDPHYRVHVFKVVKELGLNIDAAVLSLQLFPDEGRMTLAKMVRSEDRALQEEAAATLAMIDEGWSREILKDALQESDDRRQTAAIRAAMRRSSDPALHEEVDRWEKSRAAANPAVDDHEEPWMPISFDDAVATGYARLRRAIGSA